jgi:long-subunit acyl-CoA synthetase (AMP-forming)
MEFVCKRCATIFSTKSRLKTHLQRKNICEFIEQDLDRDLLIEELCNRRLNDKTFDCEFCDIKFNHASGKSQHKKICKKKPINEIIILKNTVEQLYIKVRELEMKQPVGNTTNIINNNTQINNNINLKDFGRENMAALPDSLVSTLFMDLRFRELLANLHCDPNYPENQNVRIKSIKRNTMEIFRNNKWDIMTFTNGLTELLLQGHKIFKEYYKNDKARILEEDMSEDELREILCQLDKIEKLNKNEIKPLIEDIQMMLEEYNSTGSAIVLSI